LFRVGVDGLILAANDAGLGLLGAQQPAEVLGGFLTTWILPAHHGAWRDFAQTVANGTSQSMECELTDVTGALRNIDFHGVPLVDHADGIPSLILGARDTTAQRSLEAALLDAEQRQPMGASSEQLLMLESKIKEVETDRQRLEQSLSKLPQLELLLKQGRTHLQDLRAKLEEATKERDRLAAQLGGREVENERLWAEQVQLQQSLTEQQQRDLTGLRIELQEATAARDATAARLAEREGEHERLRSMLDEAIADRERLTAQLNEHVAEHARSQERLQALDVLRADVDQAIADRDRLSSQLGVLRAEHEEHVRASDEHRQRLSMEHDVERAGLEEAVRAATTQTREAEKGLADQRLELQCMDQAVRKIEPFAAAGRLAVDVARELLAAVADIDARAACLVAECPVDSSTRDEIEHLRSESVRVSSLARQILHATEVGHSEERS
jgi:exonuclease VII small subunit